MTFRKIRWRLPSGALGLDLPQQIKWFRTAVVLRVAITVLSAGLALPASAGPKAADPHAPVPKARYRPIIEGYTPYRPVEPRPWQGVNRDVAPKPKPQSEDKR